MLCLCSFYTAHGFRLSLQFIVIVLHITLCFCSGTYNFSIATAKCKVLACPWDIVAEKRKRRLVVQEVSLLNAVKYNLILTASCGKLWDNKEHSTGSLLYLVCLDGKWQLYFIWICDECPEITASIVSI